MPQNYIDVILESSLFVFNKVIKDKNIIAQEVAESDDYYDVSSTISLSSSGLKILVTMGGSLESAKHYAKHFLRMKTEPNEELINSSLSELINIIAGDTKKRLQIPDLNLGLPHLVQGVNHRLLVEDKKIKTYRNKFDIDEFTLKQITQITANDLS